MSTLEKQAHADQRPSKLKSKMENGKFDVNRQIDLYGGWLKRFY